MGRVHGLEFFEGAATERLLKRCATSNSTRAGFLALTVNRRTRRLNNWFQITGFPCPIWLRVALNQHTKESYAHQIRSNYKNSLETQNWNSLKTATPLSLSQTLEELTQDYILFSTQEKNSRKQLKLKPKNLYLIIPLQPISSPQWRLMGGVTTEHRWGG